MEIDFITAFGRLLRDGNLRDAFAADPRSAAARICLRQADLPAWLQLVPGDVEAQAAVLLRKRLDLVKHFVPETCRRPRGALWAMFQNYARVHWPPHGSAKFVDAFQFCRHLKARAQGIVVAAEWNRLAFALSGRHAAIHWIELPTKNGRSRWGIQFLIRSQGQGWREFFFYFAW